MHLIKSIIGFLLKFPNSNSTSLPITQGKYYYIKQKILKRYGKRICYDKQYIEKICETCGGLGEVGYQPCNCDNGVWKRTWVKLTVVKLGKYEFHYPKNKFSKYPPTFKYRKYIKGYIEHEKRNRWSINFSLYVLLLVFDRRLFRKAISFHFSKFQIRRKSVK